ncbi:MAG: cob(I)yrinic acid a,c-diamide adenosyltransferase [Bacteroidales bacterium]|nr:cob(I)yrinic acid a,c-diamide adenosyltransferase [Bacteroidales bacterium]
MSSKFKIYTRSGDQGMTSLIGGKRVTKADLQVEAYGSIDEAKSYIALLMDMIDMQDIKEELTQIIVNMFVAESLVAAVSTDAALRMPQLVEKDIDILEKAIDRMDEDLPALTAFVLPGGHPINSYCHIARTVCRRAERDVLRLWNLQPDLYNPLVEKFLNRLSDYLFTLSRFCSVKMNIPEVLWVSK